MTGYADDEHRYVRRDNPGRNGGNSKMKTLALTISEACAAARVGRTTVYAAIGSGQLRAVKLNRKTLVLVADLQQWIETLPAIEPKRPSSAGRQS
jgi:excisionase family DNA binding protein